MVTVDECLEYLGIDYADTLIRKNVGRALSAAESVLQGAVGEDVALLLPDDPRAKELVLIYMDDLYSEKGVSAKVSGATRRMVADMELQLRLELRQLREEAAGA